MTVDRTLRHIDDTLTATEATMATRCNCDTVAEPAFPHRPWCATQHQHPGPDCAGLCEPAERQADAPYDAGDAAPTTYADRIPAPRVDHDTTVEQYRRDRDKALADALGRTESAIIDSSDDIWRPVEGDRWKTVGYNPMTRDKIDKMFGPLRTVLLVDIDQDDEQDDDRPSTAADCPTCTGPTRQTVGMVCPTCGTDYAAEAEVAAPGSDPDRAQDIRPAAWEQQATDAAKAALVEHWGYEAADPTPAQVATDVVRAIIDAGLAGHGGRCHKCGTGFPRTPADPDPLCWTCSTEEQTGLDEPAPDRGQGIDVDALVANVARSLHSATDDDERAEAIGMLLEGWYEAWPDSAVTDPHAPLAAELVRLLRTPRPTQDGVTQLLVTVEWHGDYYAPGERVDMLREWIEGALNDRDDSPGVTITDLAERAG